MDNLDINQQQNTSTLNNVPQTVGTPSTPPEPAVIIPPVPDIPVESPPPAYVPPTQNRNISYKTFIIIGIILTILASIGIAGTAIVTFMSKTKNAQNQVVKQIIVPTVTPTQNIPVDKSIVRDEMVKEVVLTGEDPTRPGVPVEKKTEFTKKIGTIYATVVLNNPVVGSKISYVRYFNSKYMDHGTIIITKPDSKYVHFLFSLANQKVFHPVGSYELRIYVDGQVVKMISYAVSN